MSTTLRRTWLRILGAMGARRFVATSGLGYRFVCHLGDFLGENPFYNREAFRVELELCAAWCRHDEKPLVFDVGANVGFWSTHLAQMLADRAPEIFAFEPVPSTLRKLVESVESLGLADRVHVVAAAVLDQARPARLSYSLHDSLLAQVTDEVMNPRAGDRAAYSAGLTLDEFASFAGVNPTLIKIDVEGSEVDVLRGARRLLQQAEPPAVIFELNPCTLSEKSAESSSFCKLLDGYSLYYVDDFEGQKRPVGEPVDSTTDITWVCNLFAVPSTPGNNARWFTTLEAARRRLRKDPR